MAFPQLQWLFPPMAFPQNCPAAASADQREPKVDRPAPEHGRAGLLGQLSKNREKTQICEGAPLTLFWDLDLCLRQTWLSSERLPEHQRLNLGFSDLYPHYLQASCRCESSAVIRAPPPKTGAFLRPKEVVAAASVIGRSSQAGKPSSLGTQAVI